MIDIAQEKTVNTAFSEMLLKLGKKYPNMFLLNTDCSREIGVSHFGKFFDGRFFNLGLSEANMAGVAAGFAVMKKIPLITGYSGFIIDRAFEQIRNLICYPNLNVKIIGCQSGISAGQDGAGIQSLNDIALMRSLPNMKIACPADYTEAIGVFEKSMEEYGPVYIRLYEERDFLAEKPYLAANFPVEKLENFEFHKTSLLREGSDLCIFSYGLLLKESLRAAELLQQEGISAAVLNVSSIKPLPLKAIVEAAMRVRFCVSVEDHSIHGGLGSAISEIFAENSIGKLHRIGFDDRFAESGRVSSLMAKYNLNAEAICKRITGFIEQ